jgi:hypothetical protein
VRGPETKKPPEGGLFVFLLAAHPLQTANGGAVRAVGLPEQAVSFLSGCGCQGFHLGRQTALVASSLVLVEDALVGHGVHHGLTAVRYLERSEVFAALILTS